MHSAFEPRAFPISEVNWLIPGKAHYDLNLYYHISKPMEDCDWSRSPQDTSGKQQDAYSFKHYFINN